MEEKILIKSEIDEKWKKIFMIIIFALLSLSALLLLIGFLEELKDYRELVRELKENYYSTSLRKYKIGKYTCKDLNSALYFYSNGSYSGYWGYLGVYTDYIAFILHWICLFEAGLVFLIYWGLRKCELLVTEKNIMGRTWFGKEVVLPLYQVSAFSTRRILSTIAIASSSGATRFRLIANYKEIAEVLSGLINERQENTVVAEQTVSKETKATFEELKNLKMLLDSGIITQEEFDAKKKQILGL